MPQHQQPSPSQSSPETSSSSEATSPQPSQKQPTKKAKSSPTTAKTTGKTPNSRSATTKSRVPARGKDTEPLTVDVEVGTSIQISEGSWLKPSIRISGIIVTGDRNEEAAQIAQAAETATLAHQRIDEVLMVLVSEALADVPSLRGVLEGLQKGQEVNAENIRRIVEEVKRQGLVIKDTTREGHKNARVG